MRKPTGGHINLYGANDIGGTYVVVSHRLAIAGGRAVETRLEVVAGDYNNALAEVESLRCRVGGSQSISLLWWSPFSGFAHIMTLPTLCGGLAELAVIMATQADAMMCNCINEFITIVANSLPKRPDCSSNPTDN